MSMFESASYLFGPTVVVLGLLFIATQTLDIRIPCVAFWAGYVTGLISVATTVVLLYLRWLDPEDANYHKPVIDAIVAPLLVVLVIFMEGSRLFKLRFSRGAFSVGCTCALVSAGTTFLLLFAYFSG